MPQQLKAILNAVPYQIDAHMPSIRIAANYQKNCKLTETLNLQKNCEFTETV